MHIAILIMNFSLLLHARANWDPFSSTDEDSFHSDLVPEDVEAFDLESVKLFDTLAAIESPREGSPDVCGSENNRQVSGKRRIRSDMCLEEDTFSIDSELDEAIRTMEQPSLLDDVVIDISEGETQPGDICPDMLNLGYQIPICSSGYQEDISYPHQVEAALRWCTLRMFSPLVRSAM
jgi:hypothetical protein